MSDTIAVMSSAPGQVKEILKNDLARPRNLRSQNFFEMEDKLRKLLGV